ncbi:Gamma-aminobutyric acid type B receptor subunit 2 [Dissostichus eleginoides]|uniref:Gamma-aminobutyric acid type B receptor subunit 2 n=1 Tax=Dissostichus eleginoides TaxID=100907 RepID=A0AAD9C5U2_DISEL|nr:Gamma-aminobutyric acid type B receptor subunit 2 [Dissostichus eleginoides]
MASIELLQFQGSGGVLVGDFNTSTQQLRLINHLLRFKGPAAARDRTLVLEQGLHVGLLMFGIVSSAAALTIIITLTFLLFTLIHHKHACSGCLEELLLLGLLLSSSSVMISGLDGASLSPEVFQTLCSVRLWILSLGHTVVLAVLFIRSWGLYSLHSTKPPHQRRRSSLCVLLWFLLMDAFLLSTWQILDPLRREELQHGEQDVVVRPFSETCSSTNMELWTIALCGYKAPLMGLGCFVAWSIRRTEVIKRSEVSSFSLTLSMFSLTLFSVAGAAASLLTTHNPSLHFCLRSAIILCCNICILSLMFTPQLRLDADIETLTLQLRDSEPRLQYAARNNGKHGVRHQSKLHLDD